jgi:hypothetical protein
MNYNVTIASYSSYNTNNFMKKNYIVAVIFTLGIFSISLDILDDNGKAGKTGSPGETTCNTTNCHTGNAVNAVGGSVTIDCPTMTNWKYVPGQSYEVNVTVEKSGVGLFGLGFEALTSTGANAGSFTITNTTQTTTKSIAVSGNTRTSVVHKLNGGASSNSHTFTFTWNAPSTDVGTVTFYVAGNAANANDAVSGDFIYKASQVVTSPTTGVLDVQSEKLAFLVYPNPVIENIKVSYKLNSVANVSFKLVSMTGETVYFENIERQFMGEQSHIIAIDNSLAKGVYFLELAINNEYYSQKVILK